MTLILTEFPTLKLTRKNEGFYVSGQLNQSKYNSLVDKVANLAYANNIELSGISVIKNNLLSQVNKAENQLSLLDSMITKLSQTELSFNLSQTTLSEVQINKLENFVYQLNLIEKLAQQANFNLSIIVFGTSDSTGSSDTNRILSQTRANNTRMALFRLGVPEHKVHAIGIGGSCRSESAKRFS